MPRRALAIALVVLLPFALFAWHASTYGAWLIDDAGISFAYARNLAAGHGLVQQPDAAPVEGFSNPLWTLLIALLYALDAFPVPAAPKLLSGACVLAGFSLIAIAIRRLIKAPDWAIVVTVTLLLTAANPGFVIWCVSGLENPLLMMLTAALLVVALTAADRHVGAGRSSSLMAGLLAAGLALTRPDALLYAGIYPLAIATRMDRGARPGIVRQLLIYALALALPLASYVVFRRWYFHDWLPNTFYAKQAISIARVLDVAGMQGLGAGAFAELCAALLPCLPVLVPTSLLAAALSPLLLRKPGNAVAAVVVGNFACVAFLVYLLLPGDWMGEYRYATVVFPVGYLLVVLMLREALVGVGSPLVRNAVLAGIGAAALIASAPYFAQRAYLFAASPSAPLESVARASWRYDQLADKLALRKPVLLLPDLGGALMYSRLRVRDLAGLCDRDIAALYHNGRRSQEFARYVTDVAKPDLVHVHLFWALQSGLPRSTEFTSRYVALGDGDYVRRASLPAGMSDDEVRALKASLGPAPAMSGLRAYPLLAVD